MKKFFPKSISLFTSNLQRDLFIFFSSFLVFLFFIHFVQKTNSRNISSEYKQARRLNADSTYFPQVEYNILPGQLIQPGQEVQLLAGYRYFSLEGEDRNKIHFNWCIDDLPMHGKVAGSEDKIQGSEGNYYLENRDGRLEGGKGVCRLYDLANDPEYKKREALGRFYELLKKAPDDFYLTRKSVDASGGFDKWAVRHFAGRRKPGTNNYFPGADEEKALIGVVDKKDDPDNDGWDWQFNFSDAEGKWTDIFPGGSVTHIEFSPYKAPWMMGIPYAKDSITGDNKFTNFEEYVFGTDPLSPDTDGDGISDEADVAGQGQDKLVLRINKKEGDIYNVVLYGFAVTQRWQIDKDNQKRQWEKYFRADFPNKRTGPKGLKQTEEGANRFQVGSGFARQIQLGYSPYPTFAGDENLKVKAEVVSISDKKENYIYNWHLDGVKQEVDSGLNKNVFKPSLQENKCEPYLVGVEVIDEATKKMDYREIEIPLGLNFQFSKEILGSVPFNHQNENISKFNDKNISPQSDDYINHQKLFVASDSYKTEVNKNDLGFRKGDLLKINLEGLKENYDKMASCFGNSKFEDFENSLFYNWTVNGIRQAGRSGKGKEFSEIKYVLTGEPRVEANSPQDSKVSISQGQEAFSLEIKDQGENIIAKKTEQVKISLPYLEFNVEGVEKETSSVGGNEAGTPIYSAEAGEKIKVNAHLYNFRPSKEGFTYTWLRNGEVVAKEERVQANLAAYEFKFGYSEDGEKNNLSKEEISLNVENTVDQDVFEKEEAKGLVAVLTPEEKEKLKKTLGGALSKITPRYYRQLFNLAFIPAIIIISALFGLGFGRVRKKE